MIFLLNKRVVTAYLQQIMAKVIIITVIILVKSEKKNKKKNKLIYENAIFEEFI